METTKLSKNLFIKDLLQLAAIQTLFQVFFSLILEYMNLWSKVELAQYIYYSSVFFIFLVIVFSLKYTIANSVLTSIFAIQFLILTVNPIIFFLYEVYFNLNNIINASFLLFTSTYLFFYSIFPQKNKEKSRLLFTCIISIGFSLLTYFDVKFIVDYSKIGDLDLYYKTIDALFLSSYNIYLINLSLLIFVWFIYRQGHYLLSEHLPSIVAMHTLLVLNEVYQLYNFKNLIDNFISSIVFNLIINLGFIILWLIRLKYISKKQNIKNEKYVLNYDLLKGYVDKPYKGLWKTFLTKIGKQNIFVGSFILLFLILLPIIFLAEIDIFNRLNIILLFLFGFIMIIYAIFYTQKRWYDNVGFLFKKTNKQ